MTLLNISSRFRFRRVVEIWAWIKVPSTDSVLFVDLTAEEVSLGRSIPGRVSVIEDQSMTVDC
jgi:hypothetical protein